MSVNIGQRPSAFVVDAGFALSPMGLLVTMALARHAAVWLPRGLLTLLDNDSLYRRHPSKMGGHWLAPESREATLAAMADKLPHWQRAWHFGKLAASVCWIGDARPESALADRADASLLPRFERCAAALDAMIIASSAIPVSPLDECARDAVALAAALQPDPVFLLTLPETDDGQPPLCSLLAMLGFAVRRRSEKSPWSAMLDAALVPLEAGGSGAAMLRVVAPGVLSLPDSWDDTDWNLEEAGETSADIWNDACVLWQPLAAMMEAA